MLAGSGPLLPDSPSHLLPKTCGRSVGVKVRLPWRPSWTYFPFREFEKVARELRAGLDVASTTEPVLGKPRMWPSEGQLPVAPITLPHGQLCFLPLLYPLLLYLLPTYLPCLIHFPPFSPHSFCYSSFAFSPYLLILLGPLVDLY